MLHDSKFKSMTYIQRSLAPVHVPHLQVNILYSYIIPCLMFHKHIYIIQLHVHVSALYSLPSMINSSMCTFKFTCKPIIYVCVSTQSLSCLQLFIMPWTVDTSAHGILQARILE